MAILYKQLRMSPAINRFPQVLDRKQLPSCLSLLTSPGQRQGRRRKAAGKGTAPLRDQTSFQQRQYSHHLGAEQEARLVVIAHDVDPHCVIMGKARLGRQVPGRPAPLLPSHRLMSNTKAL